MIIAKEGLNLGADWHPDGKELVLSLSHSGNPEIYRIKPDGTHPEAADRLRRHRNQPQLVSGRPGSRFYQ